MASIWIELPYNGSREELKELFSSNGWTIMDGYTTDVKVGRAIRTQNGIIARIMDYKLNEVGEPHILVANRKLSKSDLNDAFFAQPDPSSHDRHFTSFNNCMDDPDGVYEDLAFDRHVASMEINQNLEQ